MTFKESKQHPCKSTVRHAMKTPTNAAHITHGTHQVSKLDKMNPRDPERREMLVTLLYVLQDAPEALLREMWKDVSASTFFPRSVCFFYYSLSSECCRCCCYYVHLPLVSLAQASQHHFGKHTHGLRQAQPIFLSRTRCNTQTSCPSASLADF